MKLTGGVQPNTSEVNSSASVASQKLGTDSPIRPATRPAKSAPVSRLVADSTPSGMATTVAIATASSVSSTVTGSACSSRPPTGWPLRSEMPGSPRSNPPIHLTYWTGSGSANPNTSRSRWREASVTFSLPAVIRSTTSPGSRRSIRKISSDIPNSVGISSSSRRRT